MAALRILNLTMSISGRHKANLIAIGREACVITVNVVQRVNLDGSGYMEHSQYTSSLEQDSAALVREMEAIERDIASRRNLGGFKRFFGRTADARVIEACRARLNKALRLFELQSDIDMRQQVAHLDQNLQVILDKRSQVRTSQSLGPPQMPFPTPYPTSPSRMPMPEPVPQSHPPVSNVPPPVWPQPSIPSYDLAPSFPQPVSSPWPPNNETVHVPSREERREARHARREARASQQTQHATIGAGYINPPDLSIPYNAFTNIQNHLSPGGSFTHHYVNGNVINSTRDDSFRVSGSGNNINISFTPYRP